MGNLVRIERWELLARAAGFHPAELAGICAVSLRHLERFFGARFQKTPGSWLRELQCRMAKELILRGYSSKAAAAELKFANASHFCREFKRVHGVSPQSFAPSAAACIELGNSNSLSKRS
jgi:AraC-like DNA-binding protein